MELDSTQHPNLNSPKTQNLNPKTQTLLESFFQNFCLLDMTKKEFLNSLINQNLFWSYDPEQITIRRFNYHRTRSEFGNVLEILQLFNLFE